MSLLQAVTTGKVRKPPIIGLAGVAGIGKSTWAAGAPSPIFIPTEDGSAQLDVARFPVIKESNVLPDGRTQTGYEMLLDCIKTLGTEEHGYKTVVLDSLDHTEPLVWAQTCREGGKASIEAFGYGKGYVEALNHWRPLFDGFAKLRDRRGMAVIMIAHVEVKRFEDPNSDGYDRYVPKLHKLATPLAVETCDAWGFANWDIRVVQTNNENRKRGVSQGGRIVNWEERPSHIAKNRYNLPAQMALDWATFMQAMTKE